MLLVVKSTSLVLPEGLSKRAVTKLHLAARTSWRIKACLLLVVNISILEGGLQPRGCQCLTFSCRSCVAAYWTNELDGIHYFKSIDGWVDKVSVTEKVVLDSIPSRVKPKTVNLVFTAFSLCVQLWKILHDASTVCCIVDRKEADSETERFFLCLLAKAT